MHENILKKYKGRYNYIFSPINIEKSIDIALSNMAKTIQNIMNSGLKGHGGTGFPTGTKWFIAAAESEKEKYVICNADEGEPGTFKDRMILESQFDKVLAGITICAKAISSKKAYIYLRKEYKYLLPKLEKEIEDFKDILIKKWIDLDIEIRLGSGSYVCGEETALINSIEGKRGEAKNKPPYPIKNGLFGKPTVINNVETFAYIPSIFTYGFESYKNINKGSIGGTKLFCISGDTESKGLYELDLGWTIADVINSLEETDIKAVQLGGPTGIHIPANKFDKVKLKFEQKSKAYSVPTGDSIIILGSKRSIYRNLISILEFYTTESCGGCIPCRIGCEQLLLGIQSIKNREKPIEYLEHLKGLSETMGLTSRCGLGQSVTNPFISIIEDFREEIFE